jgi:hypothetical protein
MSGVFMNLVIMNDDSFSSNPVCSRLLQLLLDNISCFSEWHFVHPNLALHLFLGHSSPTHLVLFYNWAVLGLMLLRRLPAAFGMFCMMFLLLFKPYCFWFQNLKQKSAQHTCNVCAASFPGPT